MTDSLYDPPQPGVMSELVEGRPGEILDAALGVFSERGYERGSMREIAKRVGVTEPAIYRHFPGKEALFVALMRVAGGRIQSVAFGIMDEVDADNLRGQLLTLFGQRRPMIALYGPIMRTILTTVAHSPRLMAEWRETIVLPVRDRLDVMVERVDRGMGLTFSSEQRTARVRALMALFVGYFVTSTVLDDDPEEVIADALLRLMEWNGTTDAGTAGPA